MKDLGGRTWQDDCAPKKLNEARVATVETVATNKDQKKERCWIAKTIGLQRHPHNQDVQSVFGMKPRGQKKDNL
jgi:hypothetical protein